MAPLLWENSLGEKVPGFPKTRALPYPRRTLSETSVPHLVVFLKYFDKIFLLPNGPVWDVYYYTSRPLGRRGKSGAPEKGGRDLYSARFARSARTAAAGIYGGGGGLCSSAPFWASLALCQISDSEDPEKNVQKKLLLKTL